MIYYCEICNKEYKNYNSLYGHNKRYHNKTVKKQNIMCTDCNKQFTRIDSLQRHQKTCKKTNYDAKKEIIDFLKEKYNNDIIDEMLNKETIKEFDNQINGDKNNNNGINDSNLHNSLNEQHINSHNTQNFNVIVNLGDENLSELLTVKEQLKILNKRNKCLEYIIQYIHFNDKFPQFKNVMIDDLKSDKALKFDVDKKDYIVVKKNELLDDIIENRLSDIEEFCVKNDEDVKKTTKKLVNRYIKKMEKEFEDPKSQFMKEQKKTIEVTMYN